MFWKREEPASSAFARADIEGCREWTPFLTSLFDGEASEEEALLARRHLIVCQRCAGAWLDWNQTRHLLLNQLAPPAPPPNLLWRIRLACRLGQPKEVATSQLSAQILARTSRQNVKPAFWTSLVPRALRLNSPFLGAMAVGAFVIFMARGSLLPATTTAPQIQPRTAPVEVRAPRLQAPVRRETARRDTQTNAPIVAPRAQVISLQAPVKPIRVRTFKVVARKRHVFIEQPRASLARARRERETVEQSPLRLVSSGVSAPLPMLAPPRVRPVAVLQKPRLLVAPPRPSRPVALSPRVTTPSVVLASAPATASSPETSPRAEHAPRVFLALAEAPLRISAPRAHPITMQQTPTPDDSGLDDLDSTVQEYRSTLVDDSDLNSDAG